MSCVLCCENIHYQVVRWVIGAVVGQRTLGAHKGTILFPEHWQLGLYAPGGKLKDPSQGKVNCLQEKALQRKNHFAFLITQSETDQLKRHSSSGTQSFLSTCVSL